MSIFSKTSTQGMTKKTPGPRVPPVMSKPRRNITALSYSLTSQTRYSYPVVILRYLHNLHNKEEGEGQGGHHHQDGQDSQEKGADARAFLTSYNI